jgi:hypothetical protein
MPPEMQTAAELDAELAGELGLDLDEGEGEGGEDEGGPSGEQSPEAKAEAAHYEVQASRQGWVPREQYKKDPKNWVDAKTFVERGERFVNNLQTELATLRQELADFQGTKAAFVKFHEETIAKKDGELKAAIAELRVQRSQAQREGEDETVIQLEDRIELLKEQQKELKAEPVKQATAAGGPAKVDFNNPVLEEWIEDGNQWFKDEPKLRDYAIVVGETLVSNGETARGRAFLDKIGETMKRDFPRRFKAQESGGGSAMAGAASGSGNAGGRGGSMVKTAKDLPEVDRNLMKQFIKEGWTTEEKFLASYFKSN